MKPATVENIDRIVYCTDCEAWDSTRNTFLERCRHCSSPHIHQASYKRWARSFRPEGGYVYHGTLRIPVIPGSLAFRVLSSLRTRFLFA